MEKKKEHHYSNHLKELIYNPIIPEEWITVEDKRKGMRLFHCLFMTLHPDFEKMVAPELEKLIAKYEVYNGKKELKNNYWKPGTDDVECPKKGGCTTSCKYHPVCFIPFGPLDFYYLLSRSNIHKISDQVDNYSSSGIKDPCWNSQKMRKHFQDERDFKKYFKIEHRHRVREFSEYNKFREEGLMPFDVYAIINIKQPLPKLKKDLEIFVKENLKNYYEQNPEDKSAPEAYTKFKTDGRVQGIIGLDMMAKRFQAHVYKKYYHNSYKEIADKLYKRNLKSLDDQIYAHLSEAQRLIENAWRGDFPGKF